MQKQRAASLFINAGSSFSGGCVVQDHLNEGSRDANDTSTPQARVYALKVKSEAEATALAESIRDNAPTEDEI